MAALLLMAATAQASDWRIDPAHSTIGFSVRHMMLNDVHGAFTRVEGAIHDDLDDVARSSVEVVIDIASVDTHEPKRDAHLKSPDFFDAAKFPRMTFRSTRVEKVEDALAVTGNLDMHGVIRPITLRVLFPRQTVRDPVTGVRRRGATATTTLLRKDYGLLWNRSVESGGVLVGDEVRISIDLELTERTGASTPGR
jgi:polyisoprenoid-binding protein YceI